MTDSLNRPDTTAPNTYRIEPVAGGFEAQMLYPMGARSGDVWQPLNADGYWSDPDAYAFGLISRRDVFPTRQEAASAIRKAQAVNGDAP